MVAVPLAASEHFRPVVGPPAAKPYFLFVGTLEPRKNIATLIDAWREVRKTHDVDLVIVGRTRAGFSGASGRAGVEVARRGAGRRVAGAVLGARGGGVSVAV